MWSDFKSNPAAYSKAIVALVGGIVSLLLLQGVIGDSTAEGINKAVVLLVDFLASMGTAAGVVAIANKRNKKNVDKIGDSRL